VISKADEKENQEIPNPQNLQDQEIPKVEEN
jgi:hypothetical protein